jgi:hypothetical protein
VSDGLVFMLLWSVLTLVFGALVARIGREPAPRSSGQPLHRHRKGVLEPSRIETTHGEIGELPAPGDHKESA